MFETFQLLIPNLLGSQIFLYGNLQFSQQEVQLKQTAKPIFGLTSSRQQNQWSILWDNGFLNEVTCRWEQKLCIKIIESWFHTINDEGWIPIEQIRGPIAEESCQCPQYLKQDNREGSPPSLLLGIDYLSKQYNEQLLFKQFLKTNWEVLNKWFSWYIENLRNNEVEQAIFRWWNKDGNNRYLSSGLGDFPRTIQDYSQLNPMGHIDAQSWLYYFAELMEKLSSQLGDDGKEYQQRYQSWKEQIKMQIDKEFYDDNSNSYKDIFIFQNNSLFHSEHEGYPSLLPLAFGIITNQTRLEHTLNLIRDTNKMWTSKGIIRLSKQSKYFISDVHDATDSTWININYLILRGLKLYYFDSNTLARQIYIELRENLIQTINIKLNIKSNGQQKQQPLQGYLAIITLIINEDY